MHGYRIRGGQYDLEKDECLPTYFVGAWTTCTARREAAELAAAEEAARRAAELTPHSRTLPTALPHPTLCAMTRSRHDPPTP